MKKADVKLEAAQYFDFAEKAAQVNRTLENYNYKDTDLTTLYKDLSIIKDVNVQGSFIVDSDTLLKGKLLDGDKDLEITFGGLCDFVEKCVVNKKTEFGMQIKNLRADVENPFNHPIAKSLNIDCVTSEFFTKNEVLTNDLYKSLAAGDLVATKGGFWNTDLEKAAKNIANFQKIRKLVYRNGKTFVATYYVNPIDLSEKLDTETEVATTHPQHGLALANLRAGDLVDIDENGTMLKCKVRRFEPDGSIRLDMGFGVKKTFAFNKFANLVMNGKATITGHSGVTAASIQAVNNPSTVAKVVFPTDISKLKHIKSLGGSTGADLYEDKNGTHWVVKRGGNAGQSKSEALTNNLYRAMGYNAPACEIIKENGNDVIVSEYLSNLKSINDSSILPSTRDDIKTAMESSFVSHALFGNWDISENDNTLFNPATGNVYFVDNGGALLYRAQGALKNKSDFDGTVKELMNMRVKAHGSGQKEWFGNVTDGDIYTQIENNVLPKKKAILDMIKNSSLDGTQSADLHKIMTKRFDDLEKFLAKRANQNLPVTFDDKKDDAATVIAKNSAANNYKPLDTVKLKGVIETRIKIEGTSITNDCGFIDMNEFCKARKFDARPVVLKHADFEKLWDKEKGKSVLAYRSVASGHEDSFTNAKEMYTGGIGQSAYGAGVYFAQEIDDSQIKTGKIPPPPKTSSFSDSRGYGDVTHYAIIPHNFKWADDKQMNKEVHALMNNKVTNPDYQKIDSELQKVDKQRRDFVTNYAGTVAKKMNYDPAVGALVSGIHQKRDWNDSHVHQLASLVEKFGNGAAVTKSGQSIRIQLPNKEDGSAGEAYIHALTGVNQTGGKSYNQTVKGLFNKLYDDYVAPFEAAKTTGATKDKAYIALDVEHANLTTKLRNTPQTVANATQTQEEKDFVEILNKHKADKMCGLYAIWKGYDGLTTSGGNGNCYRTIFNRSKVIVSDKNFM